MIPIPLEEEPRTNCCDSKFISETDLCSDCKEHAEPLEDLKKNPLGTDDFNSCPPPEELIPALEEEEVIMKRMNNINTFHTYENDIYLSGTDEFGKDFTICFDAYNFLNWIDNDQIEYIKEQLIKHIKEK